MLPCGRVLTEGRRDERSQDRGHRTGRSRETHDAKLGSLELSVKEKQTVNVPAWAGVAAIAAGAALLLARPKG